MSNRVEELESTVAELRAAVDGLTEELVETRERLRQLEAEHDEPAPNRRIESAHAEQVDPDRTGTEADLDGAPEGESTDEAGAEPQPEAETEAEDEEDGNTGDDGIIVA